MVKGEVLVNEEGEIEFLLVNKALVRSTRVFGYAENHIISLVELRHVVSEVAGLCGASRGGVLWIEVQDHCFALLHVVAEGVFLAVLVNGRELW